MRALAQTSPAPGALSPSLPSSLPLGAGLGRAGRLRREPARATLSSSGQPCVKPEPPAGGGRGAGEPSWHQPSPFEEASALAAAE